MMLRIILAGTFKLRQCALHTLVAAECVQDVFYA